MGMGGRQAWYVRNTKAAFLALTWPETSLYTLKGSKMAIFHVEKNTDYTIMANYHLRDKSLSRKAKGLLSQMLSLPEKWDYTLQGLAYINREQIDAIRKAVHELERARYIVRTRERDSWGRLRGVEYTIYEESQLASDLPALENPMLETPTLDNPTQ